MCIYKTIGEIDFEIRSFSAIHWHCLAIVKWMLHANKILITYTQVSIFAFGISFFFSLSLSTLLKHFTLTDNFPIDRPTAKCGITKYREIAKSFPCFFICRCLRCHRHCLFSFFGCSIVSMRADLLSDFTIFLWIGFGFGITKQQRAHTEKKKTAEKQDERREDVTMVTTVGKTRIVSNTFGRKVFRLHAHT